jgi:hypothetical protein
MTRSILLVLPVLATGAALRAQPFDYRLLATTKTSTMEKEMNAAAENGFEFSGVMGGDSAFGGKEVILIMTKSAGGAAKKRYRLLATSRTGTMQKELQQAGDDGYQYRGQTVFESAFGGREVAIILQRDMNAKAELVEYKLLATSKTSTMEKELKQAGAEGFRFLGMTVGKTAFGGAEVVCILERARK